MENPQVNARISPELNVEFDRWVNELGVTRGKLAWNIVTEPLAARREGRATFSRPELARSAKADAVGISEARTAIVTQLTTEFRQAYNTGQVGFDTVATALITALTASPAFGALFPVLQRIERDPRVDAISQRQLEQGALLKAHTAAIVSWVKQPKTHVTYSIWNEHWSGRKMSGFFLAGWIASVVIFFVIAMILPTSWIAARAARRWRSGSLCACQLPHVDRHVQNRTRRQADAGHVRAEVSGAGAPAVISVSAIGSAGDAAGYYARDNYYTADQAESASAWAGAGAAELGLEGAVDADRFAKILAGELPDGSQLDAKRGEHRPGWDLTMSAPKSLSILALVGGDARLVTAVREAAAATLGWAERNLAEARVWNGQNQEPERTGKLVAATFLHDVNRNGEPQLHVHSVIANATQTADGRWRALRSDALYDRQHVMGAVFASTLRARVEALGYATVPAQNPRDGAFDIAGVPRAVIEAFSTRSAEIGAHLEARGREGTARERELAALATRSAKTPELAPAERDSRWQAVAAGQGFDAGRLVAAARARSDRAQTVWTQIVRGVRGAGERGLAIAGRMGLTPRDGDPLVPERLGRLDPRAFAAAQAVASAVRDLGEHEAAFDRLDLIRAALERGGPVTVADIEARLALLEAKGLLRGDGDRVLTTDGAVRLEQGYLAAIEAGRGRAAPIVPASEAAARAQEAARELGLNRLNPGQQAAAVLMLSSRDRVINVQGGPGRGKSTALAPVTAIVKAEGRHVIGLAVANKKANELGRETGAEPSTIARFIARHERVIDGTARAAQVARTTAELGGAVIIVEEASQVGTRDMARLVRLADLAGAARLIQTGDVRQLGAIDAGKPFELSQRAGHATAHITENLRSRSDTMKAVVAALDGNDLATVFDLLKPSTTEVRGAQVAATAAARWAALPRAERDTTLLLTAGRAMRAEANLAVQAQLKATGEIAPSGVRVEVLDRVNVTREGARLLKGYQVGRVVEIRTDLPSQGLTQGDRGVVTGVDGDRVRLAMRGGGERLFRPDALPKNLRHDAVSIYQVRPVELHAGDRIRWTDTDRQRGLNNADLARVEQVGKGELVVSSLADGTVHQLKADDRMLERLDLAYAINVHVAQGVTTDHGILALRSTERKLLSERSFLVALTRVADRVALIVDDGRRVEHGVSRNAGDKTSAMEVAGGMAGTRTILPSFEQTSRAPAEKQESNVPERFLAREGRAIGRDISHAVDVAVARTPDRQPDFGL